MLTVPRTLWFTTYALMWLVIIIAVVWQWPPSVFVPVGMVTVTFVGFTDPRPKSE